MKSLKVSILILTLVITTRCSGRVKPRRYGRKDNEDLMLSVREQNLGNADKEDKPYKRRSINLQNKKTKEPRKNELVSTKGIIRQI